MHEVLIMHHIETMWESALRSHGTSLDEVVEKLHNHLESNDYDQVIMTRFESNDFEPETQILGQWAIVEEYGYGWCLDSFVDDIEMDELPDDYVEGGNHSEIVYVPEWVKNLRHSVVHLSGAFRGECLEDMEIALDSTGAKWEYLNHLCVG